MLFKNHIQISTFDQSGLIAPMPLTINGVHVASWKYTQACNLDSSGQYLKVIRSTFTLTAKVDTNPLVRYEYDDNMRPGTPVAHWQFHAERGAFSHLLGIAKRNGAREVKPHSLSSMHFPVGGGRMRVGLEDLLEFLVRECHFDSRGGFNGALRDSRHGYRLIQAKTLARDAQEEVAESLRAQGWKVTPPDKAPGPASGEALFRW